MKALTKGVTDWLVTQGAIEQDDRELYEYAVFQFIFTLVPVTLFLLVCSLFGQTVNGLLMIVPFILLRKYSGGVHLSSPVSCFFSSGCVLAAAFTAAYFAATYHANILFGVILLAACGSLWSHSPIDNAAKPLSDAQCQAYRKVARCMVLLAGAVYIVLALTGVWHRATFWGMGLVIAAALQLPCLLGRKGARAG